jgi:hypothetical protein
LFYFIKEKKVGQPSVYVFDVHTSKASKRLKDGGTTPPLARKRKDDWRIYLHLIQGFSHRKNRAIIILRTVIRRPPKGVLFRLINLRFEFLITIEDCFLRKLQRPLQLSVFMNGFHYLRINT